MVAIVTINRHHYHNYHNYHRKYYFEKIENIHFLIAAWIYLQKIIHLNNL